MTDLKPDDRVLALSAPAVDEAARIAQILTSGLLVIQTAAETLHELRRALCGFDNTMITAAGPDDIIPWTDGFFTVIFAPQLPAPTPETARVLASGGWLITAAGRSRRQDL